MSLTTAVPLTGDDLTLADVWAVAVDGAEAELAEAGRQKLRAARELVERIARGLGAPVAVSIREDDESLVATLTGPDLGLVIGKHGQTIDAIQYLANAIVWRSQEERKSVVVDAAGYRDRRRSSLEQLADRAAGEARAARKDVSLEPMSAVERKIVHVYLQEREDVETTSEGTEPNRYVVVKPVG